MQKCHNPYFNRWFSAMYNDILTGITYKGHNPYFNRWFSAIMTYDDIAEYVIGHNPYFNRWFSAIVKIKDAEYGVYEVTILILIDGFLQ